MDSEVTFDPIFAHEDMRMGGHFVSPFIQAVKRQAVGDVEELFARLALLNQLERDVIPDVRRVIQNYRMENWVQFELGVRKYLLENQPTELPIDRNRALYQVLELAMSPFAASRAHAEVVDGLTQYVIGLTQTRATAFTAFLDDAVAAGYLKQVQRDALDLATRFFDTVSEFRPILADWDPEHLDKDFPKRLKLTGKEAFHELKAMYVDAYEVICRAFTLVTGLINVDRRNDHNTYPPHPRLKAGFQATSMADFQQKNNAPKLELLAEEPLFQRWLGSALDPDLRNAIGHNTVWYDIPMSTATYPLEQLARN